MWGTSPKGCRNNTKDVGSSVPPESPLSGEGSPPHYTNVLNVLNVVGVRTAKILSGIPVPEIEFDKLFEEEINDAFQYLNSLLLANKKSGKKPILIFDELQMIKDVVLNAENQRFSTFPSLRKWVKTSIK